MSGPEAIAAVVFFGGVAMVLRPLAGAVAKRISGDARAAAPPVDDGLGDEVRQLRQEVAELAERVDFTERMLAKQREAERLPPGGR